MNVPASGHADALAGLWGRLDALVDAAPTVTDLLDHRLGGVAARHWRAQGRPLPAAVLEEERYASAATLAAPVVLERVVEHCAGPVLLLKGPELAARYPDPTMRPSHDLDLLVEDSPSAFRSLRAAGCEIVGERPSEHHELPLAFPDLPLAIEIHSAPKWPSWAVPPRTSELFAAAAPARIGGLLTPRPAEHAVLLAAHSWAHRPLARVLDLVDVLLLLADADPGEVTGLSRRWNVDRIWRATLEGARAILEGGRTPWTLRTWARSTTQVRRPTRRDELLERCLSPFAAVPPARAVRVSAASVTEMLTERARPGYRERFREARPEHPAITEARRREGA